MSAYICSSWIEFEPLAYILSRLPSGQNLPPPPTLHFLLLKEIELSFMDFTYERLEIVFQTLLKIEGLLIFRLSFFEHKMTFDEISEIFLKYLPFFENLMNFEVNLCQMKEKSLKSFEKMGLGIQSLKKLEKLTFFFEDITLDPAEFQLLFSYLPKKLDFLRLKFLSGTNVPYETLLVLARIANSSHFSKLEIFMRNQLIDVYHAFATEYKGNSLKSFCSVSNDEDKIDLNGYNLDIFQGFCHKLESLENFGFFGIFPLHQIPKVFELLVDKLSILHNLKVLQIYVNNKHFIKLILKAIYEGKFRNLLCLEIRELNEYIINESSFGDKELKLLLPIATQLVELQIFTKFGKMNEEISTEFKYLTKFNINSDYFFKYFIEFISQRRVPLLLMAWTLKNNIKKFGGTFKRDFVLEEILNLYI